MSNLYVKIIVIKLMVAVGTTKNKWKIRNDHLYWVHLLLPFSIWRWVEIRNVKVSKWIRWSRNGPNIRNFEMSNASIERHIVSTFTHTVQQTEAAHMHKLDALHEPIAVKKLRNAYSISANWNSIQFRLNWFELDQSTSINQDWSTQKCTIQNLSFYLFLSFVSFCVYSPAASRDRLTLWW